MPPTYEYVCVREYRHFLRSSAEHLGMRKEHIAGNKCFIAISRRTIVNKRRGKSIGGKGDGNNVLDKCKIIFRSFKGHEKINRLIAKYSEIHKNTEKYIAYTIFTNSKISLC